MVPNGPKWSKIVQNCKKLAKWSKMFELATNGQNCLKLSRMVQMVQNGPNGQQMTGLTLSGPDVLSRAPEGREGRSQEA